MEDGNPQTTPGWFDVEGGNLRVHTARGRTKDGNVTSRPSGAVCILAPENRYRHLQLWGRVARRDEQGGQAHIGRNGPRNMGNAKYPGPTNEATVIYIIEPVGAQGRG